MGYIVKSFASLTEQEIYDKACEHLDNQGRRATNVSKHKGVELGCTYLNPEGDRCAVGALMTDEELTELQEGDMLGHDWANMVERGFAPITYFKLLRALQEAHDLSTRWKDREAMVNHLKEIARRFSLTPTTKEFLKLPLFLKKM